MLRKILLSAYILMCFLLPPLPAQEEEEAAALPDGFRGFRFGMTMEEVKEELEDDGYFDFTGDPDVSISDEPDSATIDTGGLLYISRGFFQFHEDGLYIIILKLDTEEIDYYTLYTALTGKYGDPDSLNPQEAVWESDTVRMSLERPLSVKYIDRTIFEELRTEELDLRSMRSVTRERFLEQF
mgnify:CR=1 FL=1